MVTHPLEKMLQRICTISVYPDFQMQMAAGGAAGMADIADDLPGLHLLTGGDADGRTVCI